MGRPIQEILVIVVLQHVEKISAVREPLSTKPGKDHIATLSDNGQLGKSIL